MYRILPDPRVLAYCSGMERVRFGMFDFFPSTGELRRDGKAVRLQAQPARTLAALVTRPGDVVSREVLQREVWPEGTHVDFERGLNFCIAQVRSALGDSADAPRYIETVPKQGYRFIAPVRQDTGSAVHAEAAPAPGPRRPAGRLVTIALALVVLLAAAAAWNAASPAPPAIVVVPFYNETGRTELDPLARSLGDATVARLAAPERTLILSVIGNAPSLANPFARQDVQRVATELDARFVIIGQLKADDAGLRVIAHLIRAGDMTHVWAQTYDDEALALPAQARVAEAIAAAVSSAVAR